MFSKKSNFLMVILSNDHKYHHLLTQYVWSITGSILDPTIVLCCLHNRTVNKDHSCTFLFWDDTILH